MSDDNNNSIIPSYEDDNNNNPDNNENNNNNNNNNAEASNRPACAACKHQRKKCKKEQCPMLKHFPAEKADIFAAVYKVFGLSNLTKMIVDLNGHEQEEAVKSFEWEALQWKKDKVQGPLGIYKNLEQQNQLIIGQYQKLKEENKLLKEQLRIMQQPPSKNSSNNAGGAVLQPGVGNIMNYCHGSGSLLSSEQDINNYTGVFTREEIDQGRSNIAAQGGFAASSFVHDQQVREVLPSEVAEAEAAYYNVNPVQAVPPMGNYHVGQSSRTSYNSLANGMYIPVYSTSLPPIDIRNSERRIPMFVYPTPEQRQFVNASQRNTPDIQYSHMNPKTKEDTTKNKQR